MAPPALKEWQTLRQYGLASCSAGCVQEAVCSSSAARLLAAAQLRGADEHETLVAQQLSEYRQRALVEAQALENEAADSATPTLESSSRTDASTLCSGSLKRSAAPSSSTASSPGKQHVSIVLPSARLPPAGWSSEFAALLPPAAGNLAAGDLGAQAPFAADAWQQRAEERATHLRASSSQPPTASAASMARMHSAALNQHHCRQGACVRQHGSSEGSAAAAAGAWALGAPAGWAMPCGAMAAPVSAVPRSGIGGAAGPRCCHLDQPRRRRCGELDLAAAKIPPSARITNSSTALLAWSSSSGGGDGVDLAEALRTREWLYVRKRAALRGGVSLRSARCPAPHQSLSAGTFVRALAYHLRHISIIRAGTLNWLRFTYDFEIGSA
jgi:hypothetical protein